MSNTQRSESRHNAIDKAEVMRVAALREILYSSRKYAVSTSWNEMVEVSDAIVSNTKKTTDHAEAKGISLKISGRVTKISEAPSDGCKPALNTAGKITRPASTATSRVSKATLNEVLVRLLSFLK